MSNPKTEATLSDHEDGDHSQPINLAAPRAPAPPVTFAANSIASTSTVTQPVTLRAHTEPQKPGLMLQALYIRAPPTSTTRPPGPGHVMTPIVGNQVGSSPHFSTKPVFKGVKGVKVNYFSDKPGDKGGAPDFKNSNISGWTVIRMPPSDGNQSHGGTTTQSGSGTNTSNILPSALAGTSSRHMVSAAVHPVISGGIASPGPMASIIKGAHQVGHVIHPPYSTHVPRGPAAVASITSAPKSAVATPILRAASHSSGAMTLASSVVAPHAGAFRARSPTLATGRTATPPVVSTIAHQQVIDLQKNSIGHSMQTQPQVGLSSRSIDITSSIRPGISHSSSVTITKPISISHSQPIVQHLQQVSEKGYLKTVSSITSSNSTSNSTPAHQNSSHLPSSHSSSSDVQNVCVVPTITRATLSNMSGSGGYATGIVQLSATTGVPTLRPSLVQPHPLHSLPSTGSMAATPSGPHHALTVISTKPLQSATSPGTHSTQLNRTTTVPSTAVVASSGTVMTTASILPPTHSRLLNAPNTVSQGAPIPIAKVYPQSLPVQMKMDSTDVDNTRAIGHTAPGNSSISTCIGMTPTTTSVTTTLSHSSNISEKRSDSIPPVRVTSLAKHPVGSTNYPSVPPATYLYDQYQGALAVHPCSMPPTNQSFATTLPGGSMRPFALSQYGNSNMSSGLHPSVCVSGSSAPPVQPLNSLMVAVDSRHITVHPPYNPVSGGKVNSELVSHQAVTSVSSTSAGLVVMSQASSAHNTSAGQTPQQGSVSNHLSPRPSILRKRPNEAVTGPAKRNIIPNLGSNEPLSPRQEFKTAVNSTVPSPKPANETSQENGTTSENENTRLLATSPALAIKKEPGTVDKSAPKETPAEASPRKKPRKQLLSANELIETHSSDTEENFDHDIKPNIKELKTVEENENVKWVTFSKRPSMSLLSNYRHSWKSRHNHFIKYSDVKPKEEKKPSVHELANIKGILQEINAWKIYHLTGQMEDLCDSEETTISRMSRWLDLEEKGALMPNNNSSNTEDYKILAKLTDIVKGNLQRSKIAQEQAMESKQQILKITDHKTNIIEIINKYVSRRPLKKKDKS